MVSFNSIVFLSRIFCLDDLSYGDNGVLLTCFWCYLFFIGLCPSGEIPFVLLRILGLTQGSSKVMGRTQAGDKCCTYMWSAHLGREEEYLCGSKWLH